MDNTSQSQSTQPAANLQSITPPASGTPPQQSHATTDKKTNIITILLLIFFYPVGALMMWFATKWPIWLKLLLTLPTLLLLFAVPLAITLIAMNPAKQFSQANDTKRYSDVSALSNAISQYYQSNNGTYPAGITGEPRKISSTEADICKDLVPTAIAALPADPLTNNGQPVTDCDAPYNTEYIVSVDSDGKVTVSAPKAELRNDITVTR